MTDAPKEKKPRCPACGEELPEKQPVSYCPHCGTYLIVTEEATAHPFTPSEPPENLSDRKIGRYTLLGRIGKGGMGEVFLVHDPKSRRKLALKRIRGELKDRRVLYERFLHEAYLTGQLAHPGVVPIYNIHIDENDLFYTMPYIRGATLKEILRQTHLGKRARRKMPLPGSIASLVRVYMSVCHIVSYAHNQGILHRDLKPENVMVGQYGEVYLLDWGLAKSTGEVEPDWGDVDQKSADLTLPGKIFGTVAFMAPEIAHGESPSIRSDIYALGVMLYQILCLRLPFKRGSIKEFRQKMREEKLINPAKIAPYRNVPHMLARICRRALSPVPEYRYSDVQELLSDLENWVEGRSDWFYLADLHVEDKADWEFQENVYLARDMALIGTAEVTEWVTMMVSQKSMTGNTRVSCKVRLSHDSVGIGFLMSIPEEAERKMPNLGYLLWISNDTKPSSKLFRSGVEVFETSDLSLKADRWYTVRIDKIDNNLYVYLDDELKFSYISHLPLSGTHVGLFYRDANFELESMRIFVGSYSINVNCLAIPDAYLADKLYDRALSEYRRIGYSFSERDEGREAKFRAGITLLEKAKSLVDPQEKEEAFNQSLEEFETLHATPGAPLEHLGKALVYQTLGDQDEESKCYELALRKHRHHPLLPDVKEQVLYRMHEISRIDRRSAYRFVLMTAQQISSAWQEKGTRRLVTSLRRHWEPLPFIHPLPAEETRVDVLRHNTAIPLAFWLARPYMIIELIDELLTHPQSDSAVLNGLYSLMALGAYALVEEELPVVSASIPQKYRALEPLIVANRETLSNGVQAAVNLPKEAFDLRTFTYLMRSALKKRQQQLVHFLMEKLPQDLVISEWDETQLDGYTIWAHLLENNLMLAAKIFEKHSLESINQENSLLHFLYGCYLATTEGEELALIHLGGVLEAPYPRSWALLGHYLTDVRKQTDEWLTTAFLWEKRQLYRQLALYYFCLGREEKSEHFMRLEQNEYL